MQIRASEAVEIFWANSYVVLGIHEIYHTLLLLALTAYFGEMTISMGIVQTVITLLLLYPTIKVFNKYIPHLIGKKEVLSTGPKNVIKNKASVPDRVL